MSLLQSRLLGRDEIAERTMAFHFERPPGFVFKAGQTIDIVLAGLPTDVGRHTFSLVSAPADERLSIATRLRDSAFKRALGQLPVGSGVGVEGPFGSLILHNDRKRAAVFIAGGIGVTPFMSMLRQAARDPVPRPLVLVYSNRRPEDSAWLEELQDFERRIKRFRLVPVMTAMNLSAQSWSGLFRRIDADMLRGICAGLTRPVCYVAGSPGMVASMRPLLNEAGIDDDDIRSEEFQGY